MPGYFPSFADIAGKGFRRAFVDNLAKIRQQKAADRAGALLELADLNARPDTTPAPDFSQPAPQLPDTTFKPQDNIDLVRNLADAHVTGKDILDARRAGAFNSTYDSLSSPAQRADFVNKLDVSPVRANGGVLYDRFNNKDPLLDESSAIEALAKLRNEQAKVPKSTIDYNNARTQLTNTKNDTASLRLAALQHVLDSPDAGDLLKVDVANNKQVGKPQTVKIRGKDGTSQYATATPNLAGGFDFTPVSDKSGKPLQVPLSDKEGALERDTKFIADTYGISMAAALDKKRSLGEKSPARAWAETVRDAEKLEFGRYARDPQKLREKALEIWNVARPGQKPPDGGALPADVNPGGKDHQTTPPPQNNSDTLRAEAEAQGYKTGKETAQGIEVLDNDGKLIGYYRKRQ